MNAQQWSELLDSLQNAEDYGVVDDQQLFVIILSDTILENLTELAAYMHSTREDRGV